MIRFKKYFIILIAFSLTWTLYSIQQNHKKNQTQYPSLSFTKDLRYPEKCQFKGQYKIPQIALLYISSWIDYSKKCTGSICKYLEKMDNVFLNYYNCDFKNCETFDGPGFVTYKDIFNSILIPANPELNRKMEMHQAIKRINGKIIDHVSGRIFSESGSGHILFLDFENAPVVLYDNIEFENLYKDPGNICN